MSPSRDLPEDIVQHRKALLVGLVALALLIQGLLYAWAGATALAYALTVGICHR